VTDASAIGIAGTLRAVLQRDLRIALRRRADTGSALVFFVIVVSLFPLGVGSQFELLRRMGPGVVWVAALLASMLAMGRLFADDHADGTLEQMLLSPVPLSLLVLAKTAAHWLSSGLLLVLVSPLLALQFDLGAEAAGVLLLSLLLGTPLLSLIGAIGAALTVGLRGAGVLLALLVLPLCTPALIFGAGAVESSLAGLGVAAHFSLLGAMLLLALLLAPLAAAAALRIALE
jgi:heme exporter protein B